MIFEASDDAIVLASYSQAILYNLPECNLTLFAINAVI